MDEQVDILAPPLFARTGEVKSRAQAYQDSDWIGTFNLWIVTREPEPAIIYQQRGFDRAWAPGLLDVTAGGHYLAGERLTDGLREVSEELGKEFSADAITHLGRKLYVGVNTDGTTKQNVIDVYMIEHNEPLSSYTPQVEEIYALCVCPIKELVKAHRDESYHFTVKGLTAQGTPITIDVSKASFPENYDDYHRKIAVLADRYFSGKHDLLY